MWIDVKDNFPQKGTILVCQGGKVREVTVYGDKVYTTGYGVDITEEVSHWMPKPSPPGENKGETCAIVAPLVIPDDVVISAIDVYCDHGKVNKDYNKARVILDLTLPKHSRFYRRLRASKG